MLQRVLLPRGAFARFTLRATKQMPKLTNDEADSLLTFSLLAPSGDWISDLFLSHFISSDPLPC